MTAAEHASKASQLKVDESMLAGKKKAMFAPAERTGGFSPAWVTQVLQNAMAPYWVLFVKHADRLEAVLTEIGFIRDYVLPMLTAKDSYDLRMAHETKNMVLHAEMKLRASLFREESRGTHYREDFPTRNDPEWLAWVKLGDVDGEMKPSKEPIPEEWWPDLSIPYNLRYFRRYPGETW